MNAYNKPSALDVFRKVINNTSIGDVITRTQILNISDKMGAYLTESYIDNVRRQLTVCEFLKYTGIPGKYIVKRHVPSLLTIPALRKETQSRYAEHVDTYINNSKKTTEDYMKIIAEREATE